MVPVQRLADERLDHSLAAQVQLGCCLGEFLETLD